MKFSIRGCARIRARDFTRINTLTIASVLPGVADDYPDRYPPMECDTPQLHANYVRSSPQKYVKNPYFPPFSPKTADGTNPYFERRIC
jgi:hypothetical protein